MGQRAPPRGRRSCCYSHLNISLLITFFFFQFPYHPSLQPFNGVLSQSNECKCCREVNLAANLVINVRPIWPHTSNLWPDLARFLNLVGTFLCHYSTFFWHGVLQNYQEKQQNILINIPYFDKVNCYFNWRLSGSQWTSQTAKKQNKKTNEQTTILIKKSLGSFSSANELVFAHFFTVVFNRTGSTDELYVKKLSLLPLPALANVVEWTGTWRPVAYHSDLGLIDHSGGKSFISRTNPSEPPAHRWRGGEEIGALSEMSHEQVWGGETSGDGTRGLGSNTADHSGMEPKPQERTECWPVSTRVCCSH